MSAFRSIHLASSMRQWRLVAPIQQRALQISAIRSVGQESSLHKEGRAEEAESKKQEQLKAVKEGTNEWTPELASDSETAIKADRGEADHSEDGIKKLQEETKNAASEKHN